MSNNLEALKQRRDELKKELALIDYEAQKAAEVMMGLLLIVLIILIHRGGDA